ncbi:integrase core domain-containing protein [Frankia nepalensis]|nr:hypothetical protein [Frankia nepalensis]
MDWTLIWNRCRAEQVLSIYVEHYNTARPHRSTSPIGRPQSAIQAAQ